MVEAMGGEEGAEFKKFQEYCWSAFKVGRGYIYPPFIYLLIYSILGVAKEQQSDPQLIFFDGGR